MIALSVCSAVARPPFIARSLLAGQGRICRMEEMGRTHISTHPSSNLTWFCPCPLWEPGSPGFLAILWSLNILSRDFFLFSFFSSHTNDFYLRLFVRLMWKKGWWRCVGGSLNSSLYIFKNNFILLKYLLFFLFPYKGNRADHTLKSKWGMMQAALGSSWINHPPESLSISRPSFRYHSWVWWTGVQETQQRGRGSRGVEAKGYLSAFSDRVCRYASPCSSFLELLSSSTFLQDLTSRNRRSLSFLSFLLSGPNEKER